MFLALVTRDLVWQASSVQRVKASRAALPVDILGQLRQGVPMPMAFDGYVERSAKVSSTCLMAVAYNRYSVPCERAGQRVSTRPGGSCQRRNDCGPACTPA